MKIPSSVDAFIVDDRARARGDAADASSNDVSTHYAETLRTIRLQRAPRLRIDDDDDDDDDDDEDGVLRDEGVQKTLRVRAAGEF